MQFQIERIYLTAELQEEALETGNSNTDVIVFFRNGQKYLASFFAYHNLLLLAQEHKNRGEYLNGKYFWSENMVMIDNCSRSNITEVVKHLLEEGEFQLIFKRIK